MADDLLPDGLPEALYTDIESAIHIHMGHDGQSDEANDWVTDLMSAITPFIEREVRALSARLAAVRELADRGEVECPSVWWPREIRAATADPTPQTETP